MPSKERKYIIAIGGLCLVILGLVAGGVIYSIHDYRQGSLKAVAITGADVRYFREVFPQTDKDILQVFIDAKTYDADTGIFTVSHTKIGYRNFIKSVQQSREVIEKTTGVPLIKPQLTKEALAKGINVQPNSRLDYAGYIKAHPLPWPGNARRLKAAMAGYHWLDILEVEVLRAYPTR